MFLGSQSENRLLSQLPSPDWELLRRHLRSTVLPLQSIIFEAGDALTKAYFPYSGAISLVVVLSGGQMIETALVGS